MLSLKLPKNEAEFQQMMEFVDVHLRESGVTLQARPIRGWLEVSQSLELGLRMTPKQNRPPAKGSYEGDDMTIRIFQWFDERYGERLKMSWGPGRVFILLRHDPWMIDLPRIYGSVVLFASTTERSTESGEYLRKRERPRVNVVESIENLTDSMKASLTPNELRLIFEQWMLGFNALSSLEVISGTPMVAEVQSDIEAAVKHAMAKPPHYGQSKWSSLQATEKALKIFLSLKQVHFPKLHKLLTLVELAEATGLMSIDRSIVNAVQCSPAIRYGEVPTTALEGFEAHVSSLKIIHHVGTHIKRDF